MKHQKIVSNIHGINEPEIRWWHYVLILGGRLAALAIAGTAEAATASWYDYKIGADGLGRPCANGTGCWTETRAVAASREYPRGSWVRVANKENGRTVVVQITDWIEHPERDIDLSSHAFSEIAALKQGVIKVTIEPILIWDKIQGWWSLIRLWG